LTRKFLYKATNNLPSLDQDQWEKASKNREWWGSKFGIDSTYIKELFEIIHKHSLIQIQKTKQEYLA
jgi:hypothetical protein